MAPVPATITVNFIANYAGTHRIAYRSGGAGPYSFVTTPCVGGGTPCSGTIAITVDNETCDNVVYDGYVQATCEDEESVNGRIPFTVTFTPNPVCDAYSITCNTPGGCATIPELGTDCDGNLITTFPGIGENETFWMCSEALPTAPGYVVTALTKDQVCCYDCEEVTFTTPALEDPIRLIYIDCATRALIDTTVAGGAPETYCVVAGAYNFGGTVTVLGTCP